MVTMTNGRMAYLLSLDTIRAKCPIVRWIEENIHTGKANSDYGERCKDVIQEVSIRFVETVDFEVVDGKVTQVITGRKSEPYFADCAKPTRQEIDLIEVCEYSHFKWLRTYCFEILAIIDHPHSCSIDYYIKEEPCVGCDKDGPVNYLNQNGNWSHYCGGSPRCCP